MPAFIASKTHPLIYLNMPKAGCTSIKNWIYKLDRGKFFDTPMGIHEIEQTEMLHYDSNRFEVMKRFRSSFVFTFVRHPLKRAYALYNEKFAFADQKYFDGDRAILKEIFGVRYDNNPSLEQHRSNFTAFLYFIRASKRGHYRQDWHWMPQSVAVEDAMSHRYLDFIGHIETIDDDFEFICKKAGCEREPLPRLNEGSRSTYSYNIIVNDEIRSLGTEIYAVDLSNFGYSISG